MLQCRWGVTACLLPLLRRAAHYTLLGDCLLLLSQRLFEILLLKIQVRPVTRRVDERFPASTRPTAEREL